jgi:hypothetical protein
MDNQTTNTPTTQTTDTATAVTDSPKTEEVVAAAPVVAGEGEAVPDVAVTVEGVQVAVTDTDDEGLQLTPATGAVLVLVVGLLAVAVTRLRKK